MIIWVSKQFKVKTQKKAVSQEKKFALQILTLKMLEKTGEMI